MKRKLKFVSPKVTQAVPLLLAAGADAEPSRKDALAAAGVRFLATETVGGLIALPLLAECLKKRSINIKWDFQLISQFQCVNNVASHKRTWSN